MVKSLLQTMDHGSGVQRPTGRWAAARAGLAVLLGLGLTLVLAPAASATTAAATSSDSVWVAPAAESGVIEFEGRETDPTSDDQLSESEETYAPRRLRPREHDRPARVLLAPRLANLVDLVTTPSPRAVARLVVRPDTGRDILTRHRRLLI